MSANRIRVADVTIERPYTGGIRCSAVVPGPEGFRYWHDVAFFGYTARAASKLYRDCLNEQLEKKGYIS